MTDKEIMLEILLSKHSSLVLRHSVATTALAEALADKLLEEIVNPFLIASAKLASDLVVENEQLTLF